MFRMVFAGALMIGLALPLVAAAQNTDSSQDKNFDVRSSVGDLHIGADADARKIGLPLYPGARLKHDDAGSNDGNSNRVNMGVAMEAFGFQLVVANYDSDDAPGKVIDFYRDKLKKYGKVLECHTRKHGGDVDAHSDDKDSDGSKEKASRPVKCDDNGGGPVTELKAGTEDNQHVVAIEPRDSGRGATFALVYVRTRGKQGDI